MEKLFVNKISTEEIKSNTEYIINLDCKDIYFDEVKQYDDEVYASPSVAAKPPLAVWLRLKNIENVVLDFCGAVIVFHGKILPFVFDECKNITLKNVEITYDRPYYTQADILDGDGTFLKIHIDEGYNCRYEDGYLYAVSDTWERKLNFHDMLFQAYNKETGNPTGSVILALIGPEIFPHKNLPIPIHHLLCEPDGDNYILKGEFPKEWVGGTKLCMTHEQRDKNTITTVGGENITIDNVRIDGGASLGFVAMHTKNITFNKFNMFPDENHPGMVSNNADAIHGYNCSGKIILNNCHMARMLDDTFNIHCNYLEVTKIDGNKIFGKVEKIPVCNRLFLPDDEIAVYEKSPFKHRFNTVISNMSDDGESFIIEVKEGIEKFKVGDIVENITAQPDILFKDCVFEKFRGTTRLQSRGKIEIDNCVFKNTINALLLGGDLGTWYESGAIDDLKITNCKFMEYGSYSLQSDGYIDFSEDEKYYYKNIEISNCEFDCPKIMKISNAQNITLKNNKCKNNQTFEIQVKDCDNIISDCELIYN